MDMTRASEDDDDFVTHGKSAFNEQDDPYVNHGKNLIAEVSVTAHSDLVSFFTHEGISVSSEHSVHADTVRLRISGSSEAVDDSLSRFVEQHPKASLHILEAFDDEGDDSHSS